MTRNTFSVSFYVRESKAGKKGLAPIEMGINCNGKRLFINLQMKVKPEEFNRKRQPQYITDYCDQTRIKVNNLMTEMLSNNIPITSESLRDCFRNGGVKSYTVGDMLDGYIALKNKEVVAGNIGAEHLEKIKSAGNHLLEYVSREQEVTAITPELVKNLYADLQVKYKAQTAAGKMTKIKSIIRFAIDNGKLPVNPIASVRIAKPKPEIHYLTEDELRKVYSLQLDSKSLSDVRDAFILQASSGLSYSDVCTLRKEDIHIMEDGTHYISKNRNKTDVKYTAVILPMGVEVLKRHNYELRIISNQKYNEFLKAIQGLTGITTNMTTHVARKSYATLLLNRGVRVEVVSKAVGHSNTKQTLSAYSALLNKTVINEIKAAI